jgi:hypothetical protein
MGRACLHHSLKARISILHACKYQVPAICNILGIKKSAIYTVLQDYRLYGVPWKLYGCVPMGRPCLLNGLQLRKFKELQNQYPTAYYDKFHSLLALEAKVFTLEASILCTHCSLCLSHKKAILHAGEANPLLQAVFVNRIGRLVPNLYMLMFIDKSAKDKRTVIQQNTYSLWGGCVELNAPFVWGKHYSVLPVLTLNGIIAQKIVEGSVMSERFEEFLREQVVRTQLFCVAN